MGCKATLNSCLDEYIFTFATYHSDAARTNPNESCENSGISLSLFAERILIVSLCRFLVDSFFDR